MSMNEYVYFDHGIILKTDDCYQIAESVLGHEPQDIYEVQDVLDELDDVMCTGDFIGEVIPVNPDGTLRDEDSKTYDCDVVYYVSLSRESSLFERAYGSIEDIVKETKEKVGKYFPDDFDYAGRLVQIIGKVLG